MTLDEVLLKQYELFSNRKLHYGRLFWQLLAVFVAVCVVVTNAAYGNKPETASLTLVSMGSVSLIVSYISYRVRQNESSYEKHLNSIEVALRKKFGEDVQIAPMSKQLGSRLVTTLAFIAFGFSLIAAGIITFLNG